MKEFLLILYRPFFLVFLGLNTAFLVVVILLLVRFDVNGNKVHYIGKFWSRMNLLFSGVSVKMHGLENIEKGQPYVVMLNHQSHVDVWALIGYLPLQLRWVMKQELRDIPFFGIGCERMGHVYIDRKNPEKSHEELKSLHEKFASGTSVVFFPEGSRNEGELLPFKKGGFVIALQGKVPILPIAINGSRSVLPRGSKKVIPGRIDVYIHTPVSVDSYSYESKEQLMETVRNSIASKTVKS